MFIFNKTFQINYFKNIDQSKDILKRDYNKILTKIFADFI